MLSRLAASLIITLLFTLTGKAQKACPVNFNTDTLQLAAANPSLWHGKIISFNALVGRVENHVNSHAIMQVKLTGGANMWVGDCRDFSNSRNGDILRVMGFFTQTAADDTATRKVNADGYWVIALAVLDMKTKQMVAMPGTQAYLNDWIEGKIPTAQED